MLGARLIKSKKLDRCKFILRFGDINEKESEIYKLKHDKRAYHLLDSVGTKPNVVYQVKVRNEKKV